MSGRPSRRVSRWWPAGSMSSMIGVRTHPRVASAGGTSAPDGAGERTEELMSKVVAIMSMSLDGYVADRNDGGALNS